MRIAAAIAFVLAIAAGVAVFVFPATIGPLLPSMIAEPLGLADRREEADRGSGDGPRPVAVRVAPVRAGTAVDRYPASGEVVAADEVMLSSEVAGEVAEVLVEDGARLRKGEPVLRFDRNAELRALEAVEARLAEAEANLARQRVLFDRAVVARAQVDTARAAAAAARADVEAAEARLADETVRAPFDGALGIVRVSPGAFLSPGDPIADFKSIDDLRVRFTLPLEVARGAAGADTVTVEWDGTVREAPILVVSPLVQPRARTRTVEARLPADAPLDPGAFVTVGVVTARRPDALFVPHEAVERAGFQSYVYRVEEDADRPAARRTLVETGVFRDGAIEIRSGLGAGDRVVASGLQKVREGAPLRILDGEAGGDGRDGAANGTDNPPGVVEAPPAEAAAGSGRGQDGDDAT